MSTVEEERRSDAPATDSGEREPRPALHPDEEYDPMRSRKMELDGDFMPLGSRNND